MNAGARQILHVTEQAMRKIDSNGDRRTSIAAEESAARANDSTAAGARPRVFVAAENRLLREVLSRMLVKNGEIDVVGTDMEEPFRAEDLLEEETDVLLLSSRGIRNEDLTAVRKVRTTTPKVRILVIGVTGESKQSFCSACGREFAGTCRETLQQRKWWKACERCKEAKRSVLAGCAQHCSAISNEKRRPSLLRACASGWD